MSVLHAHATCAALSRATPRLFFSRFQRCCRLRPYMYCCCCCCRVCVCLCLQLWYIVPPAQHQRFVAALQQHMGLPDLSTAASLAAVKTLLPLLPSEAVRKLGARRLLQKPGDIVLTCPVSCIVGLASLQQLVQDVVTKGGGVRMCVCVCVCAAGCAGYLCAVHVAGFSCAGFRHTGEAGAGMADIPLLCLHALADFLH